MNSLWGLSENTIKVAPVSSLLVWSQLEREPGCKFITSGIWVAITVSVACMIGRKSVLACLLICALLHPLPEHDQMCWPGSRPLLVKMCKTKRDTETLPNNSFKVHCGPLTKAVHSPYDRHSDTVLERSISCPLHLMSIDFSFTLFEYKDSNMALKISALFFCQDSDLLFLQHGGFPLWKWHLRHSCCWWDHTAEIWERCSIL